MAIVSHFPEDCGAGALISRVFWRRIQKEVEVTALSMCVKELLCIKKYKPMLRKVLNNENVNKLFDVSTGEDSNACINDVQSPAVTELSKQVDVKYQFYVDYVRKGDIKIHFLSWEKMLADMLTRNLKRSNLWVWLNCLERAHSLTPINGR